MVTILVNNVVSPEQALFFADHYLLLGCQVVKGEDEPDSVKVKQVKLNLKFEVFKLRLMSNQTSSYT